MSTTYDEVDREARADRRNDPPEPRPAEEDWRWLDDPPEAFIASGEYDGNEPF